MVWYFVRDNHNIMTMLIVVVFVLIWLNILKVMAMVWYFFSDNLKVILVFVLVQLNGVAIDLFVDFFFESHGYGFSNHKDIKGISWLAGI